MLFVSNQGLILDVNSNEAAFYIKLIKLIFLFFDQVKLFGKEGLFFETRAPVSWLGHCNSGCGGTCTLCTGGKYKGHWGVEGRSLCASGIKGPVQLHIKLKKK